MNDAVQQTLLARVYDVAIRSPLTRAAKLSNAYGCDVYLKREDLQPVHSFKLRGAYNKMVQLTPKERERGIIAASAGNHAQGVALAAQKLGMSALIVMPRTTPSIKIEAVRAYGAAVELYGDNYSDAAARCEQRTRETGRTFIHPFDDHLVIAGQGTVGREIVEQLSGVTHIFVPVGGGGLIAGIAGYVKALRPDIKIIAVEPEDSNALQVSLREGHRITLPHVGIFADGVAVKQVGMHTFEIARRYVDACVTVGTDEVCAAIKAVFEETRSIVEPAGALSVAGVVAYAQTHDMTNAVAVSICSGANMSFERLQFIAERTLLGGGQEALFAVTLPEKPGALRRFCKRVVQSHSITQFGYRLHTRTSAVIFVGISMQDVGDKKSFIEKLQKEQYTYSDLSLEDITKEHIRHMIGGHTNIARHERMYAVNFPERPGALQDFLSVMSDAWNISLFHYRGQAGDQGSVLIGFEAEDVTVLEQALARSGYTWSRANAAHGMTFL